MDWEKLRQSVVLSTAFLDNVVDANAYVPAVPQLKEAALRARRIGLGIMGLGDLMYHVGIRYGSRRGPGVRRAGDGVRALPHHADQHRAGRGARPLPGHRRAACTTRRPAVAAAPADRADPQRLGPPGDRLGQRLQGIEQHGIRNAAQTTVAPTGTIATVAGCEGYGCEPVFALAYMRHVNDQGKDLQLTYASPLFEQALERGRAGRGPRARRSSIR